MQGIVLPTVNGLAQGMLLFLVAGGLSLVFGVMGILNFAHGAYFMLGAYLAYTLAGGQQLPAWQLLLLVLVVGVLTALIGVVTEVVVFRRMYGLEELNTLLATYALLLVGSGLARQIWGVRPVSLPQAAAFSTTFSLAGVQVPLYDLVLLASGLLVASGLWVLLYRTDFGRTVRAVAYDRWMAAALGIDVNTVFTVMFGIGIFLAGVGGGLYAPLVAISPDLAFTYIIQAFAVVIIGGIGNLPGTFGASLLVGLLTSFLVVYAPELSAFSLYLVMVAVLLFRPGGLFGARRTLSLG
ncbi:MAG: hypothetical protein KatS3mg061_0610 [Dehalococcoidia bacterium]|nr:MAG: hypothetical protein KatS3mg061_0610 [Dehalococcoidia bacterium]